MQLSRVALAVAVCLSLGTPRSLGQANPAPAAQPARLERIVASLDGPGCALAFNPDLEMLAVGTERGSVQLWNRDVLHGVRSGEKTADTLPAHGGVVTTLASRASWLVTAGTDRRLCLWSLPDANLVQTMPTETIVRSLAFSPDARTFAAAGEDGGIALYEIPSLKPLGKLLGHTDWVTALAFSPDGQELAAGAYDGQVSVWHIGTQQRLQVFAALVPAAKDQAAPDNTVLALAWSLDGATLVVGGTDRRIHFFQAADGKHLRSLAGHNGAVTALAYSADGKTLASAAKDRTVRLWRSSDSAAIVTLEGHAAWVEAIAFVGQGARLVSVGADRTLRFWNVSALPGK